MQEIKRGLIIFLLLTILTGLIYPFLITGIAQLIWPYKANGSLITKDGHIVGSKLIGQKFLSPRYFHGRPSSIDYKGDISGSSNLGPTSKKLLEEVQKQINKVREENMLLNDLLIPPDIVLSSASGLDPHISQEAAFLQALRVAKARGIPVEKVQELIYKNTELPQFKIFDKPKVNVLTLNLDLELLLSMLQ
ncbi:MAG: potassium-transporting ATPase subunit KdpC [Candidatus Melainabacteria bacterium]|nr:potassium-transporting ATPase subunit KdpC [Candidatus Melainabacteria bacterium]